MIKLNGIEIDVTIFPDKTSQVWQIPEKAWPEGTQRYNIIWDFESEAELFHVCQLVRLIRYGRIPKPINLHMPYLPYGRQDKQISNETTFALHVFSDIINSLKFDSVTTIDAHSEYCYATMDNFESIFPNAAINKALRETRATMLGFPDAGACKRYSTFESGFINYETVIGHKVRNQTTGWIESYKIEGDPTGKDVLIVDDLVDGGMTFILMTKDLLKAGAKSVNLYVSHGIFSKGTKVLFDSGIKRIFTHKGEVELSDSNPTPPEGLLESELSNI